MKVSNYLKLLLMIFLIGTTGCISFQKEVVYASLWNQSEELDGAIRIATNKKIPVTVDGKEYMLDLGGYYAVHSKDLRGLLQAAE